MADVYVLTYEGGPLIAHTTFQGAAEEMAAYPAEKQTRLMVVTVELVED